MNPYRLFNRARIEWRFLRPSSRPGRLLFNHIPKCAGTSVHQYLHAQYPPRAVYHIDVADAWGGGRRFREMPVAQRHSYHLIIGHHGHELISDVHPDTKVMTIFREPVSRLYSLYRYILEQPEHYLHHFVTESQLSFLSFVHSGASPELQNYFNWHLTGLPQDEIARDPESAAACAMEVLERSYHFVGVLDSLPSFMSDLSQCLRYSEKFGNRKSNVTGNRSGIADLKIEVLQGVGAVNQADLILFEKVRCRWGE